MHHALSCCQSLYHTTYQSLLLQPSEAQHSTLLNIWQDIAMNCWFRCPFLYDGTMVASDIALNRLCMLTLTIFHCSPLNSNTCSAEHTPHVSEQHPRPSKHSLTPLIDPPAPRPGPPPPSLHLPIITIPILITVSDFIGALAAGKQRCSVLDV